MLYHGYSGHFGSAFRGGVILTFASKSVQNSELETLSYSGPQEGVIVSHEDYAALGYGLKIANTYVIHAMKMMVNRSGKPAPTMDNVNVTTVGTVSP